MMSSSAPKTRHKKMLHHIVIFAKLTCL